MSASTSAIRRRWAARASAGSAHHAGNARCAAATAASTSAAPLAGTRAHTAPVDGSTLSSHSPDAAGPGCPSITCGKSVTAPLRSVAPMVRSLRSLTGTAVPR